MGSDPAMLTCVREAVRRTAFAETEPILGDRPAPATTERRGRRDYVRTKLGFAQRAEDADPDRSPPWANVRDRWRDSRRDTNPAP
jgi:hypothetical protein